MIYLGIERLPFSPKEVFVEIESDQDINLSLDLRFYRLFPAATVKKSKPGSTFYLALQLEIESSKIHTLIEELSSRLTEPITELHVSA